MQTGIKLQWEIEGHDACYLGSAKMEWKMYSPSTLGCQGGKTNRGEEWEVGEVGEVEKGWTQSKQ